ncbi:MAG TPA: Hsp20/alpha crystallin family protein [Candidatus Limnocylindrales bacterium]|nr:Hsp20/alpha crystallin family protein [Candidatus Limnocylindrales bacterium]
MLLTRSRGTPAFPGSLSELSWLPFLDPVIRLEKYRKDDKLVVLAEMPGIDPAKDVSVTAQDGVLRVVAVRLKEIDEVGHSEFHYGTFYRTILLPPGTKEDTIRASYTNGILEITMTVGEPEPGRRTIPVTVPNGQPEPIKKH